MKFITVVVAGLHSGLHIFNCKFLTFVLPDLPLSAFWDVRQICRKNSNNN